jgi:hypothetical protein
MGTKTMREAPRVARSLVAAIIAQVLDLQKTVLYELPLLECISVCSHLHHVDMTLPHAHTVVAHNRATAPAWLEVIAAVNLRR